MSNTDANAANNENKVNNDDNKECNDNDPVITLHPKSRIINYPNSKQQRLKVPDDKVSWNVKWPQYDPPFYTAKHVLNGKGPDPKLADAKTLKWNQLDGKVNRVSHMGKYKIVNGIPQNPNGRTGLLGRGHLWRWGPNHAADPIVTRFKRDNDNNIIKDETSGKNILEFVAIMRTDGGGYAIPGGMIEPGDTLSRTLKKEFGEEAMNSLEMNENETKKMYQSLKELFDIQGKYAIKVYAGYCDDPRNTDNSWMETVAYNFHDKNGDITNKFKLKAGDDACAVQWMSINKDIKLYASHEDFIKKVAIIHDAHW